jgi:DNA repair exonuclease SbcCD ATPase subunit
MSEVFLSSIAINDFRTFGTFSVDLPAAPGLLLLSGTNGLGKSSFFDAIEWALTGRIRRFTNYVMTKTGKVAVPDADYLTRYGAKANSHEVELQYGPNNSVRRSASVAPSMEAVSQLLAYSGRGAISDLSTHLAMTHFLGQAERQRFTSRESDDQWAALKGPSGVDRLELVRTRLRGKATTLAFGRRIKAEKAFVADLEKAIADWIGFQARLERFRLAVRAGGGLTQQDVRERALEVGAEAASILRRDVAEVAGENNTQLLARMNELLLRGDQLLAERAAALNAAGELVDRFFAEQAKGRGDQSALVAARRQAEVTRVAASTAQERASLAAAAIADQAAVVSLLQSEIERLEATRDDQGRSAELKAILVDARSELDGRTAELSEFRQTAEQAGEAISAHSSAAADVLRLQAIADRARDDVESVVRLEDLKRIAEGLANQHRLAVDAARAVQDEYELAIGGHSKLTADIDAARSAHAEAERHASAIAAAVTAVAAHLHDNATICPVCSAHYVAGELKFLANAAAKAGNSTLAAAALTLEALEGQLPTIVQRIDELQAILLAPEVLVPAVSRTAANVDELQQHLELTLQVSAGSDLTSAAASRLERASLDLQTARSAVTPLADAAAGARQSLSDASAAIDLTTYRIDALNARIAIVVAEDQSCLERIAARALPAMTLGEVTALLLHRRNECETAIARLAELRETATRENAAVSTLVELLSNHNEAIAEAEAAAESARGAAATLAAQWTEMGLPGLPDSVVASAAITNLSATTAQFKLLPARLQALAKENQDVLLDEDISLVLQQMRAIGGDLGLGDPSAYLKRLRDQLGPARDALQLTQDAHDAVDKYTVKLGDRAEAYNREVLQPLNDRILEFNAAMLSTPGASVQFRTDKRLDRTDFEMELRYGDEVDDSIHRAKKVPPQVVLSEGQLAANGFSILCAASTAYRWSRWRALLLDDPLQHNDIIHTAAFVDVMRNLVELEGYQLIMSSHDRAESDFIARKFDAAGLACTTVLLTAPSENGVISDPPTYNTAARHLMPAAGTKIA